MDSQGGTDQEKLERNPTVLNNEEMLETLGPRVSVSPYCDQSAHHISLIGMGARMKV